MYKKYDGTLSFITSLLFYGNFLPGNDVLNVLCTHDVSYLLQYEKSKSKSKGKKN